MRECERPSSSGLQPRARLRFSGVATGSGTCVVTRIEDIGTLERVARRLLLLCSE
jgi:hypothetical protein